jgi:hypothetical protein
MKPVQNRPCVAAVARQSAANLWKFKNAAFSRKPLRTLCGLAIAVASVACKFTVQADLIHRYSFNDGTANDSVGSANGILMGNVGGGPTISGGQLQLNNPNFSGPGYLENYLSLPASILPSSGSATIEEWFTFTGSGFFTEAWTFSNNNNDSNPPGSNNGQYLMGVISAPQPASPPGGPNTGGSHIAQSLNGYAGGETDAYETTPNIGAVGGGYLDNGETFMMATVIDGAAGTVSYYLYDVSTGVGGLQQTIPAIPLGSYSFSNAYLGRSAFLADNATSGSINEFRIYNVARSAAQVAADLAAGPEVVHEPTSLPINLTGWNRDVIVEKTATTPYTGAALPFDVPNDYSFYEIGLPAGGRGLPPGRVFTSLVDDSTVFQLQPYNQNNVLQLSAGTSSTGTLTLATPAAYSSISVLAASANSYTATVGNLVLNFSDGTASPMFQFNNSDWFFQPNAVIKGFGRLVLASTSAEDNGDPYPELYQTTINLAALGLTNRALVSVEFLDPSIDPRETTGIFAISGSLVAGQAPGGAADNAANYSGQTWVTGTDIGFGFLPWTLMDNGNSSSVSGHFIYSSRINGNGASGDIDTNGQSFGIYANSGAVSEAIRPFALALAVGQTFSMDFDNGYVGSGGQVGIQLQNSSGEIRGEFFATGGAPDYFIRGGLGLATDTGIALTQDGLHLDCTLVDADTMTFVIKSASSGATLGSFTGALGGTAGSKIDRVRVYNSTAGPDSSNDTFFNSLAIGWLPPVAQGKNVTVSADANCSADASIDNGSYSPNPGDTITLVQSPSGPYPLGDTSVTLTVTDNHGLSNSCVATVTVADTTPPVITCPGNIVTDATSPAGTEVSFAPAASDNCSAASVTSNPASGSPFAIGDTTVTSTAIDAAGNQAACTFTVHVKGAAEQINGLIARVQSLGLQSGAANSLIVKLHAAASALDRGNTGAACGILGAFLNEMHAQTGKKITADQAALITADATRIRAVVGCR